MCHDGDEQYCLNGDNVHTYNDKKRYTHIGGNPDTQTFGGYSGSNTIHEAFVLKIPDNLDNTRAAPILCAGITMWDPLVHWGARNGGKTVGIVGIGGLGTMGIKLAHHMGNKVVAISSSDSKRKIAEEKGATGYCNYNDPASLKEWTGKCDLILDTVAVNHQCSTQMEILKKSGTIVLLGLCTEPMAI